ncbi:MAG: GspH/FimT family pseudopilin [Gammaproteobacteria bacterium]|nr:GspH/FimT family pseudopilin [Gammaproteobacteria bacterium]
MEFWITKISGNSIGFTLLECLVVLGLISLLVALILPSFAPLIHAFEIESQTYAFANSLYYAKSEAIRRNAFITFCPKPNCSEDWNEGWIIFVDNNRNHKKEDSEILLYDHTHTPRDLKITWTGKTPIQFNSTGFIVGFDNGSFFVCSSAHTGRAVVLNRVGRVKFNEITKKDCPEMRV